MIHISLGLYEQIDKKMNLFFNEIIIYIAFFLNSLIFAFIMLIIFVDAFKELFKINETISIIVSFCMMILLFFFQNLSYKRSKYFKIKFWTTIKWIIIYFILLLITNKSKIIIFYILSYVSVESTNYLSNQHLIFGLRILFFTLLIPFSIYISALIIYLSNYNYSTKNHFISSQKNLEKLLEEFQNNEQCKSQESNFKKRFTAIFFVADYYKDGLENIRHSFGEDIQFDNIVNTRSGRSINETFDYLIFSIPFFLFYGGLEQLKEMQNHLININRSLDDLCCIEGNQFINEIFEMNNKIESFFKENSLELSKINANSNKNKYIYYEKRIILLILSLISSIILSKLV